MAENEASTDREPGEVESRELTPLRDPAVRALLDHVAEELAAEFVRLMKASVATESEAENQNEERR